MLGIINLNKPTGKTSHDMVSMVRRALGIRRVGHAGTLDPEASGVLPILVGKATALSDLLIEKTKVYTATVRLGIATDTYDITGVVREQHNFRPTPEQIMAVAQEFVGDISQLPPMYSAIKVNGKKLYELARKGEVIDRKPRQVHIYRLECSNFVDDGFTMTVECSKGTYIRSLCHDIGKALGTCACMASLVRNQSGPFYLTDAVTIEELQEAVETGQVEKLILPPETVLASYPAVSVSSAYGNKIRNGLRFRVGQLGLEHAKEGDVFRLYENDVLLCLVKVVVSDKGLVLAIDKSFY